MAAFQVAYLRALPFCHDAIDDTMLQFVPELRIFTLTEAHASADLHHYGMVLVRMYAADDDLLALVYAARQISAAGCPIVFIVPPEAEARAHEAIQMGVDDYLLATPLQMQRLPHMIERATTMARMAAELSHAQNELNLRARAMTAVNDGLVIVDARLLNQPVIYCNPAFTHITGYAPEEILGQNCRMLQGPETDLAARAVMRHAIDHAQPCHVIIRNYRRDGTPFWNEISLAPVIDETGQLTHIVGTQRDVTVRLAAEEHLRQRHQRQQGLSEVGKALADIRLNETIALQQAAQHAAQLLGDVCTIMLITNDRQRFEIAALYHADPAIQELSRDLFGILQHAVDEPRTQALLTSGQALMLTSKQIDRLPRWYQPGIQAYREHVGLHGLMLVPLWAQGEVIGMMVALRNQPNKPYTADDLSFFQEIAEWTALSVANLRLFQAVQRELAARQIAEESLRATEAHYRMLVEHIPLAISTVELNQPNARPYVSPQIEALLGFRVEEWYQRPYLWRERAHPDDLPSLLAVASASNYGSFQHEHRQLHRDGHIVWINYQQQIITVDQRRFLLATLRDVTERKQAEESLRESNERYDLVVQGSSDGIWDWNVQTDLAYFSPRFRELLGYDPEPHYGSMGAPNEVIHPDDRERTIAAINAHLTVCTPFHLEYRLKTVFNGYRWFLVRGQGLWDSQGRPIRMAGSLTDIHDAKIAHEQLEDLNRTLEQRIADRTSELQRALADLRDSEQHLRTVVTNAPIILFSIDHHGDFTLAEGRGMASLGYSSVQAIGQSVFNIYHDRPDILQDVRQALAGERITTIREIGRYVFETWYTPLMDADGGISGVICVSVDITARQQAEQELRERGEELARVNRELARAARLKDEFLANMSHELRTPLTSILGRSELLQEDSSGLLTEFQRRSVRSIEESGRHLLELINDILDLSKIEAGKITLEPAAVIVAELCQSCVRMIHATAFKQRLTVHISIDPAVVTIIADERRLKQILVNLLSNAIKFTPVDREIGLEVRGDAAAQQAHFTVWDTGIGITKDDQARLFQPFVQIDSSLTRQYEGTGLGLVLVAHLAAMHGGRVTLESALDQGSRFTLTLPWIQPAMPIPPSITSGLLKPMMVAAHASDTRPALLLVEDNLETQQLLAEYLEIKGYAVTCANNGYEALDRVQAQPPNVIVMDVQMPKLDGLATIRLLRTNPAYANMPILVLSARAMPGDREQILAAGANAYLSKPVQLAELNHTVATLIASVQKGTRDD